tara:strand:- start:382 stop:1731 length:1350 start_codon:yes stop_codon:yes gene_type:complete
MRILIADVYPDLSYRLIKDTAGGYGTGNDFSGNFFYKFLNKFLSSSLAMPPMSAIYIYSILRKQGHEVDYKVYQKNVVPIRDYDAYIVPSSIIAYETEIEFINKLVKKDKLIFVTGIFSNIRQEGYNKNVIIVKGEPEKFFLENNLDDKTLNKQLLYEKAKNNKNIDNLDILPFPLWSDYLKEYKLKNNFLGYNSAPAIPITFSRGCPYSCFNYCTYPLQQGRRVRFRSVKNVVDEIELLNNLYDHKKFVFRDPVFSINRAKTIELCNEIIERKLKIYFLIETHLSNLDDELIKILAIAGLKMVYVGVESSSSSVLKDINRFSITNDMQYKIIKKLKDNKIITKTMFMLANPEDNNHTINKTIEYAKFLPNELVQFSIFTPYPGTPIFASFKDKLTTDKMENFNQYKLVYKHKNFNSDDINLLKLKAYYKVYIPKKIFVIFKCLLSFFK